MTLIQDPPVSGNRVQFPEVTIPSVPRPPAPPTEKSVWPRVVRWGSVGLAGVGVGVALGLGVMNTGDVDSLKADVTSLQSDLSATQVQLQSVRSDLVSLRAGSSLAQEHLAQAPVDYEHLAQVP